MLPTLLVILTLAVLYWFPLRRWMGRWGTTSSDLRRVMAGDGLIVDPTFTYTMAATVNAQPEHIWPWLVQMGYQRGGLYSYDWVDRLFGFLDRPSVTRILPEFQHLAVGDKIPLPRGQGYPVAVIEPERALVLDMRNMWGFDWVWQFGIYAIDEKRTRLVSRSTLRPLNVWTWLLGILVLEPAAFLMTRRMLLGLKQHAETLRAQASARAYSTRGNRSAARPIVVSLAWDIALNATIPVACYWLAKRFISPSELAALIFASVFPLLKSVYDVTRHREIDPVAVLVLLGIATSILALAVGGDPRMLLIRESFFTGAFGIACLISLTFPRPIMFYFGRYFMAGKDPEKRKIFDARWQNPIGRHAHRLVTVVWGLVYAGEFVVRVILVYRVSAPVVLVISPFLTGVGTILTVIWTFWYAFRVRARIAS